jgi:RNA polymerase sigma-70 factor, ECF subfamily
MLNVPRFDPQTLQMDQLYQGLGPVIFSRARRLLKDSAEAEDATQEVFIRVMKHWKHLPDDEATVSWVLRICTNYCLNLLRNRRSRSRELPEEKDCNESPERELANRDFAERALAMTPTRIANTARLYYVDGLEQQRVAETLAVTRRTVCNHLEVFLTNARALQAREDAAVENPRRRRSLALAGSGLSK